MSLIFEDKVKNNRTEFISGVREVARNIGTNPNWLMGIMWHESGLNAQVPDPYNPSRGRNTHTSGLIQFAGTTPETLGTTHDAIRAMPNVQQLYYVQKFYEIWMNLGATYKKPSHLFLANFYPRALIKGYNKDKNYIFGSETSAAYARRVGQENGIFDLNKDGVITMREYDQYHKKINKKYGISTVNNTFLYIGVTALLALTIGGYYYYLKYYAN